MNRRNFLKSMGIGIATLALPEGYEEVEGILRPTRTIIDMKPSTIITRQQYDDVLYDQMLGAILNDLRFFQPRLMVAPNIPDDDEVKTKLLYASDWIHSLGRS